VDAAKKIIQSSITASQRDCCSRLQCSRLVGVTVYCPPWRIRPCDATFCQHSFTTCFKLSFSIHTIIDLFSNQQTGWRLRVTNRFKHKNVIVFIECLTTASDSTDCLHNTACHHSKIYVFLLQIVLIAAGLFLATLYDCRNWVDFTGVFILWHLTVVMIYFKAVITLP